MEHFYENIPGWFSYDYLYRDAVQRADDGALFVEIGSFKGRSSAFMCVEIVNSGKKIKFDCIDPMKLLGHYVVDAQNDPEAFIGYSAEEFHQRLEPVKEIYNLQQVTSEEAYKLYEDKSIDFLLIDGDHDPAAVKRDIINFLPKMKEGGVIAGDDAFVPEIAQAARDAVEETDMTAEIIYGIHFWIEITE
jgi:predicted O-methyltransferase YrrM